MIYDHVFIKLFFNNNKLNSNYWKFIRRYHKGKYSNIKDYLLNRYKDVIKTNNKIIFKEVLYRILKNIEHRPLCLACNKYTKFNHNKDSCYNDHCSIKCEMQNKNIIKKQQNTKLEKYGSINNIEKYKQTCINKYGVNNAAKLDFIKEKTKQTNIEKYGYASPLQNNEIQEKTKQTNIEKYGYENAQSSPIIKEKIKNSNILTCNLKYGVNNVMQIEEYNDKLINTCIEKYGVNNVFKSEEIKEKIKQINVEKYGYEYPIKNKIILQKQLNTKRKNHTFNTSKIEEESYKLLKEKYQDIKRQYESNVYPFECDFFIPSLDLYIECNYHWTHGYHPYNKDSEEDQLIVEKWKEKNTKFYNNAITTWTKRDVKKRIAAKENNLNYLEFYNINELKEWLNK